MTRHTCAYPALHHSTDIMAVWHGQTQPTYLCGYHASAGWIAAALKGARR